MKKLMIAFLLMGVMLFPFSGVAFEIDRAFVLTDDVLGTSHHWTGTQTFDDVVISGGTVYATLNTPSSNFSTSGATLTQTQANLPITQILQGTAAGVIGSAIYDASGATKEAIDQAGNKYISGKMGVGIGVPSDPIQFEVGGNIQAYRDGAHVYVEDDSGPVADIYAGDTSIEIGSSNNYEVRFKVNDLQRAVIKTSGSFGINTTSPNANVKLDVDGIIGAQSGVSVGATSPISGLTSFVCIDSGVSPVGSMTRGAIFYSVNNEMWVNDGNGTHTQISPHDPETGELYVNSYNIYTGKGEKYYPKRQVTIEYIVEKINPEIVAKVKFVKAYVADESNASWAIVSKEEAIEANIVEEEVVITDSKFVKAFNPKTGEIETKEGTYILKKEKSQRQDGWKIKTNCRVDEITGIFEKRIMATPEKAEKEFKFNWERMPKFVRNAWGK